MEIIQYWAILQIYQNKAHRVDLIDAPYLLQIALNAWALHLNCLQVKVHFDN